MFFSGYLLVCSLIVGSWSTDFEFGPFFLLPRTQSHVRLAIPPLACCPLWLLAPFEFSISKLILSPVQIWLNILLTTTHKLQNTKRFYKLSKGLFWLRICSKRYDKKLHKHLRHTTFYTYMIVHSMHNTTQCIII